MMEWTKDKEKRILVKYRFTLTLRIIRVLFACLFLFWVYMMGVSIAYESLHLDRKHAFYSKLALEWKRPNIEENFGSTLQSEITPFLTQKISYPVFQRIGKEAVPVGEVRLSKRLFTPFSSNELLLDQQPQMESPFSFYLPEKVDGSGMLAAEDDVDAWPTLEKVHEGTVADFAFSTTHFMKPKELFDLLEPYDLDVLWMPLYAGELKAFETSYSSSGTGDQLAIQVDSLGFTGGREMSDDYMSEGKMSLSKDNINANKEMMLTEMNDLLEEESKSYYENFLGLTHLEERYNYLKQNDFQVYGAVVTGPVKELLKLKNEKEIRGVQLGELRYWNWEKG
ncbi:anti-sigma factor [Cytobacillus spongiae]|uniref:anti-sigma factor n=1 Tax=Cytobacillus spongiae TaxID=2901381 RepID=UPI001F31A778|nr:anti-sigma factor [Cytobacillus spongiae]UII55750.1 anti-sigma factor [Cytobacillus spongiae]